jgi:orotidine-5'-phosphate decarboxylase
MKTVDLVGFMMKWDEKLTEIVHRNNSLLCVGLDTDAGKLPACLKNVKNPVFEFNRAMIDATRDVACAYKLNLAFYEAMGPWGSVMLERTLDVIPKEMFVILDGKRNDIGNTAAQYAKALFDGYQADAATVNPYLGKDGLTPFLEYKDKCSFILCRTSNPSAGELQDLKIGETPLYQVVAKKITEWNMNKNCGAVVGATYPDELRVVRGILGDDVPILIPGVGKQGGDVEKTIRYGTNSKGEMALINSSREILYASSGEDYADAASTKATALRDQINTFRPSKH